MPGFFAEFFTTVLISAILALIKALYIASVSGRTEKDLHQRLETGHAYEFVNNSLQFFQDILLFILLIQGVFVISYILFPTILFGLCQFLHISHMYFAKGSIIFVILISWILLFNKVWLVRIKNQQSVLLRGIQWKKNTEYSFPNQEVTKEELSRYSELVDEILGTILGLALKSQSRLYNLIATAILKIRGVNYRYTSVWIKLADVPNNRFVAKRVKFNPPIFSEYTKLIDRVHLPFYDKSRFANWLLENNDAVRGLKKTPFAEKYTALKTKWNERYIYTSVTSKIFYDGAASTVVNVTVPKYDEPPYLSLIDHKQWKAIRIRSCAGIPIIYEKKKLGVLFIASNIPVGVTEYDLNILMSFSTTLGRLIYWGAPKGMFGDDFVDLLQFAPDYIV